MVSEKKNWDFSVCKFMVLAQFAFEICESLNKVHLHLEICSEKSLFLCKPNDAGNRVPARKLFTRPGYINTRILTGLEKYLPKASDPTMPMIGYAHPDSCDSAM